MTSYLSTVSPAVFRRLFCAMAIAAGLASVQAAPAATAGAPDFTREVRPILSRYCFKCHGPDDAARKGKLRLDLREDALKPGKSGALAVVPGKPDQSEVIHRILADSPEDLMPPPETKQALSDEQKSILRRWIETGAEYRQHWSFVPPKAEVPTDLRHPGWVRNPIDAFVLARLEKAGLAPSPEADPLTIVRRLWLDLVGLPPTPEEADAFVRAHALNPRDAIDGEVDRLLASPRYGERWARRWLDLARYADTNGYEKDRQRNIWPYRDWVIRALNADLSFDQFSILQIAGDLVRPDELPAGVEPMDRFIATGFHRNTMLNEEGGIDPLEFRFHAMNDRVVTTGTAWLGLTLQCAQCHTHKYDPVTQREYYQLMACLNNADEPEMDLPDPAAEAEYQRNLAKADALLVTLREKWPVEAGEWSTPTPVSAAAASGEVPKILDDQSVLFAGPSPDKETHTLVIETDKPGITSLRLETLTHDSLPSKGPGRVAHGNFVLSEIRITAQPRGAGPADATAKPVPVRIVAGEADVEQKELTVAKAFDGDSGTGWAVHIDDRRLNANHRAEFQFAEPVGFPGGTRFVVTLEQAYGGKHTLGRIRLSLGRPSDDVRPLAVRRAEAADRAYQTWLNQQRSVVARWQSIRPASMESNLPLLQQQPDDSIFASGDITKSDTYTLHFQGDFKGVTAIRLEALPDDRLPAHGPGLTYYEGPKGDFFLGEFQIESVGQRLAVTNATESYGRNNFGSSATAALAVDGDPQTGWSCAGRFGVASEAVFPLAAPIGNADQLTLRMLFGRHFACSLGRFRLSVTRDPLPVKASPLSAEAQALLKKPAGTLSPTEEAALNSAFLLVAPELAAARAEIDRLRQPPNRLTTLVLRERPAGQVRPTHIHKRGEFLQPTDRVDPGVIRILNPLPSNAPVDRLAFARWLVSPENPLTPRVTVNRAWQAFFGRGLVRTVEDFGLQGEAPSHPELLDWLAIEFVRQGWSLKKLHRLIATSATYLQDSRVRPPGTGTPANADPDNRLLSHFPRTRLDGEILRDGALRASGLLSTRMGGPGVYPPQPEGITEVTFGQPKWPVSSGEDRHRRSIYTFIKRTAPFALFTTFDGPSGEACLARRDVSNTPLQALSVMNDIAFTEAAQALGRVMASTPGDVDARLTQLFRRCLTRPPSADESRELRDFLERQLARFRAGELDPLKIAGDGPGDAAERAAWAALARVLINLDEALTKG